MAPRACGGEAAQLGKEVDPEQDDPDAAEQTGARAAVDRSARLLQPSIVRQGEAGRARQGDEAGREWGEEWRHQALSG